MIIECKKIPKNYKPIKGNEKEIIKHLLKYNYYDSYSIEGNRINLHIRAISFDLEKDGMNESFVNDEPVFFKCENNGKIKINYGEPKTKKYIGVVFDVYDEDFAEIFKTQNFKGLTRNNTYGGYEWELKTKDGAFRLKNKDLVMIDENLKIIDCLRSDGGNDYLPVLLSHDYRRIKPKKEKLKT